MFEPIWDALNARSALIFIYPAATHDTAAVVNISLPYPSVDFAQSTLCALTSILTNGTISHRLDLDVVLSYAGGAFPDLAQPLIDSLTASTDSSSKEPPQV